MAKDPKSLAPARTRIPSAIPQELSKEIAVEGRPSVEAELVGDLKILLET